MPVFAKPADADSLLLDSIGESIFAIDLEGRCTFVKPAALRLLGHRAESGLGRNKRHRVLDAFSGSRGSSRARAGRSAAASAGR